MAKNFTKKYERKLDMISISAHGDEVRFGCHWHETGCVTKWARLEILGILKDIIKNLEEETDV